MKYLQLLKIVTRIIEKSGIRSYCREICKGNCCYSSNRGRWKCNSTIRCEEKLPCAMFICKDTLWGNSREVGIIEYLKGKIHPDIVRRLRLLDNLGKIIGRKIRHKLNRDEYFKTYSLNLVKDINIQVKKSDLAFTDKELNTICLAMESK